MTFDDLTVVNAKVNLLPYKSDAERYNQPDFWTEIDAGGDCEDFAISKMQCLKAMGWPISVLRLACCYVETGEYHAVLLADYDGQTYALDNRYGHPMEWQLLPYKFDRIQVAGTRTWELANNADRSYA